MGGIKYSKGDYLMFIDIDDYLVKFETKGLKPLLYENDLLFLKINNNSRKTSIDFVETLNKNKLNDLIKKKSLNIMECWGYIFSKKIINDNNILFPEIRIGEDQVFMFKYLENVNKATKYENIIYEHTSTLGGLSSNFECRNIDSFIIGYSKIKDYEKERKKNELSKIYLKNLSEQIIYHEIIHLDKKRIKKNKNIYDRIVYNYINDTYYKEFIDFLDFYNNILKSRKLKEINNLYNNNFNIYLYCCSALSISILKIL